MTLSMYSASVPVFLRALANLDAVLRKGEAHAATLGFAPEILLQTRLIADMFPLLRQVQIATDTAKNGAARLAGVTAPKFEDDESRFDQLHARIERATTYIRTIKPEQIDGSETRAITVPTPHGDLHFDGQTYLLHFALPNLFFHCTTAYAILRQSGVTLGKQDYLGPP